MRESPAAQQEGERLDRVYRSRREKGHQHRYSYFQQGTLLSFQERERIMLAMLNRVLGRLSDKRILDIGCGTGRTLLPFVLYGASMEDCFGVDILENRIKTAQATLADMNFVCCSADELPFEKEAFDVVTMFTCLSSVLDNEIRQRICREALSVLRPGGCFLIYDFRVNNPWNKETRRVTLSELKGYFPELTCLSRTLTLIPQLGRIIGRYSPTACGLLSLVPFLRTHRITMFQKPVLQQETA